MIRYSCDLTSEVVKSAGKQNANKLQVLLVLIKVFFDKRRCVPSGCVGPSLEVLGFFVHADGHETRELWWISTLSAHLALQTGAQWWELSDKPAVISGSDATLNSGVLRFLLMSV